MKNQCTIYLVRHGETEWNEKKLKIVVEKVLRERFFGRFEGKSLEVMRKIFSETMLVTKEAQKKFDINNVETDEEILARLMPFLIEKSQKYIGKKILIVTHGGLLRAFLSYVNYKVPKYSESPMRNAGYLIIESDGVDFKIIEEKLF